MSLVEIKLPNYKECTIDGIKVDPSLVIKHKLLHQELVDKDMTLTKESSSLRSKLLIGGVLRLINKYTFGTNEKGVELFEFQPVNWRYPTLLVPSNIKKNLVSKKEKITDYFVVVSFVHWNNKIPIGTITQSIGTVHDQKNKYDVLLYYYPQRPITKIKEVNSTLPILSFPEVSNDVYTIDPPGCEDIDDAISFDFEKGRLGIHIADTTTLTELGTDRYSTVYAPHKIVHMVHNDLATNSFSLLQGEKRNVITCWINSDLSYEFDRTQIIVKKNLSYDEAERKMHSIPVLQKIFEISKVIGESLKKDVADTHQMIEVLMIRYNQCMTDYCESKFGRCIYRNQKLFSKASYSYENNGHEALGLSKYTHSTSPIRRYADQLIQKIFINSSIDFDLEKINSFEKELNRLYRMWDYLLASQKLVTDKTNEYELELIEIDDRLTFKCEELKIHITNKIPLEHKITNNKLFINGQEYTIGQKYKMKLYLIEENYMYKILIQF